MTTFTIELDDFIAAVGRGEKAYDAYTSQPTVDSSLVEFDLNKEVLSVFKSLKQRFQVAPRVFMQADYGWTDGAELALERTDTVDGLELALMRNPKTLKPYIELMEQNKEAVAHGEFPDMFCHFYIGNTDGDLRIYLNVKAQNAGAVIIFLLEKLKAKGHTPGEVIGGFKFPYVRSNADKRRDVLVVWSDSSHLDDLIAALKAVQVPMGDAFLAGPPLTTGQVGLKGVGFAPHLHDDGYSYGTYLRESAGTCGVNKTRWKSAITNLYVKAGLGVTLSFS